MYKTFEDTAVVMPTLNEGKALGDVLKGLLRDWKGISVIVCDDGSRDGTAEVAASFGKQVRFLDRRHEREHGLTASVLDGIAAAKSKYVIVMDGDGQHPAGKVGEIVARLREGKDIVVARRESVPGWRLDRQVVSKGAEMLGRARLMLQGSRNPPQDILSGFFGVRADVARELIARGKFVKRGYKVLFEMLKAADSSARIGEVGYVFGSRGGGSSKMGLRHFGYFLESVFS